MRKKCRAEDVAWGDHDSFPWYFHDSRTATKNTTAAAHRIDSERQCICLCGSGVSYATTKSQEAAYREAVPRLPKVDHQQTAPKIIKVDYTGMQRAFDVFNCDREETRQSSRDKTAFICPVCLDKAWGKPSLALDCRRDHDPVPTQRVITKTIPRAPRA
jgi:hypothetical protein